MTTTLSILAAQSENAALVNDNGSFISTKIDDVHFNGAFVFRLTRDNQDRRFRMVQGIALALSKILEQLEVLPEPLYLNFFHFAAEGDEPLTFKVKLFNNVPDVHEPSARSFVFLPDENRQRALDARLCAALEDITRFANAPFVFEFEWLIDNFDFEGHLDMSIFTRILTVLLFVNALEQVQMPAQVEDPCVILPNTIIQFKSHDEDDNEFEDLLVALTYACLQRFAPVWSTVYPELVEFAVHALRANAAFLEDASGLGHPEVVLSRRPKRHVPAAQVAVGNEDLGGRKRRKRTPRQKSNKGRKTRQSKSRR